MQAAGAYLTNEAASQLAHLCLELAACALLLGKALLKHLNALLVLIGRPQCILQLSRELTALALASHALPFQPLQSLQLQVAARQGMMLQSLMQWQMLIRGIWLQLCREEFQ